MSTETNTSGKGKHRRNGLKSFLGGRLLASEKMMKQLPFFFFVAFLGMLMISNRYWSEKTIRRIEAVQDSIKELRAESVTWETELMKMNRPSEIVEKVQASGLELQEASEPPRKLKVEKTDNE